MLCSGSTAWVLALFSTGTHHLKGKLQYKEIPNY